MKCKILTIDRSTLKYTVAIERKDENMFSSELQKSLVLKTNKSCVNQCIAMVL